MTVHDTLDMVNSWQKMDRNDSIHWCFSKTSKTISHLSFDKTFYTEKRCQGGPLPGVRMTMVTGANVDVKALTFHC